jgi:phosphate transport system substrate-binding protein
MRRTMVKGLILIFILFIFACTQRDKNGKVLDTTTSGSIRMVADESLKPIIDAELNLFHSLYKKTSISVSYTSEPQAMDSLLKDSVMLIVITRKLLAHEEAAIREKKVTPHQAVVAKEGIALIFNKKNPISSVRVEELKEILNGTITSWKQLGANISPSDIQVVFDHPTSGMTRFLHDSITAFDKLPPYCFAVKSNPEVIDYVSKTQNAIGLIGMSWISDADDVDTNRFLSTVNVAGLSEGDESYQPYQAYIAQGHYPLIREIVMITRQPRVGLATGFMNFVASDKGQRVILKSGLVPVTMPIRIVQINQDPLIIKK